MYIKVKQSYYRIIQGMEKAQKQQLFARNEQLSNRNKHYKAQVLILKEQLYLAIAWRYAASSEKISPDQ